MLSILADAPPVESAVTETTAIEERVLTFVVYNTRSHRKEAFETLEDGVVRMYNCGPTVYNRQHIGNFRSFLFADILRRWLEYIGYEVKQVMNITDVGHLLEDADEGEDKIEAQARREKRDPLAISQGYAANFLEDLKTLDFAEAMLYPRASDHIPEMLEIIQGLIEKGYAYQVGGNVYYDVNKFARYGELSGNKVEDLEAGKRIEVNQEKRNAADFALWKSDPKHLMKWETEFGPDGFPGWHIECSAMARKHLGDQIDLHTGGEDNVFPHHECEIAQTEAFTDKTFASYWMHAKFLQVDGGKMSKSLGNVYTLDDIEERGYSIRALRFCLIRGHYRQPLNFTWDILKESQSALSKLDDLVQRLERSAEDGAASTDRDREVLRTAVTKFEESLNDDLAMPQAIAALFVLRSAVEKQPMGAEASNEALEFLRKVEDVLGVLEMDREGLDDTFAAEVETLIAARKAAREGKDWTAADRIRDELDEMGITLEDTADGMIWKRS
ncbi:MAG: cysteinyl-tRNA synthetase [Planctomycetota bacterium]